MLKYLGLGLLAYRVLASAGNQVVDNLVMDFDRISLRDFAVQTGVLTLRFRVLNNNIINLRIKSIRGTLSHNNNLLARVNTPAAITLAAGEEKKLRLEIKIDNESVLDHLTNLLTNGGGSRPLILKGIVNVNGIPFPFTKEIHLRL